MAAAALPNLLDAAGLEPARAATIVGDALLRMDDGELFVETVASERLVLDDGRLKSASRETRRGFGLRAVSGEAVGLACSGTMDEAALARAAATVQAVAHGQSGRVNEPAPAAPAPLYTAADPLAAAAAAEKAALLAEIDAWVRGRDPRVVQVAATLQCQLQEIEILRGDGARSGDRRPLVRLDVGVTVAAGERRETASHGGGGRIELGALIATARWQAIAAEALRQALVLLEAEPAPAGEMTVVLGPGWPGVLLHEAVGHGLEGDFNRKRTSAFAGLVGERVAARGVTVVDQGDLPERRGSLTIDDEGTPTGRTVLIEDGILVGFMQDRHNARLMGVRPTGNGRRQSHAHVTMPRMTNTFMLAGAQAPEEIVAGVERGLYAVSFGGGQVDITSGRFVFQATEAYRIERGKIGAPVKGAMLIGNGPEALTRITAIGNDLALDPGVGTCGKNGQGVPVGVGQPTLRIERMTVGGTRA
jgi:TldD protein